MPNIVEQHILNNFKQILYKTNNSLMFCKIDVREIKSIPIFNILTTGILRLKKI